MKKMNDSILNQIINIADKKLMYIQDTGHALEGNNGAYFCQDTPVRNSAHWCISYGILYMITSNEEYYNTMVLLADYLVNEQRKTPNGTIKCIEGDRFDSINGLIGQAWVIEALIKTAELTNDDCYYDVAVRIFNAQLFDYINDEWIRIDTEGKNLGSDLVFNHQLWFAASGAIICRYREDNIIHTQVDRFLKSCDLQRFATYKNGLIKHYGNRKINSPKYYIKKIIQLVCPSYLKRINPDRYNSFSYEAAYHLFNLYGFALIKNCFKTESFFSNKTFLKSLDFGLNISNINRMVNCIGQNYKYSKYSYPYNSPAFEYAYVCQTFIGSVNKEINDELWKIHNEYCYSKEDYMFNKNTDDPETLTARIYEYMRYLELTINYEK